MAEVVGELNTIFSGGTSAQDQSDGNLAVVEKVFDGAANLAQNVSYTENVSDNYSALKISFSIFYLLTKYYGFSIFIHHYSPHTLYRWCLI